MPLQTFELTHSNAGQRLQKLFEKEKHEKITSHFKNETNRLTNFTIDEGDFYLDFSKHRISQKVFDSLIDLANEADLESAIEAYYGGEKINVTEGREVLHTALRSFQKKNITIDGKNISAQIDNSLEKLRVFTEKIHSGKWKGFSNQPITDIVNIGIGGSDLGPQMVVEALQFYHKKINTHFVSNVDGDYIEDLLQKLNPETTLFLVVSKSFSTQETLANAHKIKQWLLNFTTLDQIHKHFVGVTAHPEKAIDFGIDKEAVFPMWNWVGGRFSLWSAVGVSIACAIGFDHFKSLLAGAEEMDQHFYKTPFNKNMPVVLGVIGIWYSNFYKAETELVVPYSQYLKKFPMYLQQAAMESNGKSMGRNQKEVLHTTGTIVWGTPGTNAQHAYFQLLHQGNRLIPADFIGFKKSLHQDEEQHRLLMANFFGQTEALLKGRNANEITENLKTKGISVSEIEQVLPYMVCKGNQPTTTLLIDRLSPHSLGKLIALYEHKIFVQGVIWNIFSFDQWGVELGKNLAKKILTDMKNQSFDKHDISTSALLKRFTS